MIDLFKNISAVLKHIQFLDPGLGGEAAILEYLIELISAGGEAHAAENVLLVSHVTIRYRRFLALVVHLAYLYVAFRSSHRRK